MKGITKEQFKKEWNPNLFALIGMDEREFFNAVDEFEFTVAQAEREKCEKHCKEEVSNAHSIGYQKGKHEANVRNKRGY